MKITKKTTQLFPGTVFLIFAAMLLIQIQARGKDLITLEAKDGLTITADLYTAHPNDSPFIILFHQARWSRGEYIEIAPKLNEMGFNCMAVDLRSGGTVNQITNRTHRRAVKLDRSTDYLEAMQDMNAAVRYVKSEYENSNIIVWGSSYSASLAIRLAANMQQQIDGVLAFSPGEYFDKGKTYIENSAQNVKCPIFITSASDEAKLWKGIFLAIAPELRHRFLPKTKGNHGSRALWSKFEDSENYWEAVRSFLHRYIDKGKGAKHDAQNRHKITDKETSEPDWLRPRSDKYVRQRRQMVRHIRELYGLEDEKVLEAMQNVPRHWFVPENKVGSAYNDSPLLIGYGQTISQPLIVAYMTSQLKPDKNDKVLEIGTGSGYQAAVLSEFTPHVFTIEIIEPLARATAKKLKEKGYKTIQTKIGDGYKGWPEHAPFDAIIVTAAPDQIPAALVEQLAKGGKMIVPVGRAYATQQLLLITKDEKGDIAKKKLMPVRFVPMVPGKSK